MNEVTAHEEGERDGEGRLTWNDIARIHGIFVLNEAKAIPAGRVS
jgi:hypothetical protein